METLGVLFTYPMSPYLEEELSKRFPLFRLWESPPSHRKDFIRSNAQSIRAVVGNSHVGADAETIDMLPKLEIVSSFSVGLDKVDLEKCRERSIRVTNTPDVLTEDVADLAIGLAIATMRQICASDRYVRSGSWKGKGDFRLTRKKVVLVSLLNFNLLSSSASPICIDLSGPLRIQAESSLRVQFSGKTVGIVGLGRIGLAIARRAEAFGCPINYYTRSEKPEVGYKYHSNILDLAANSNILVVVCPLTEETHHIINRDVINALGPEGVLINVGRGPLVDETELVAALLDGRLGGAGLDVYEHEPEPPEQLYGLNNVVLLPHVGSGTWETRKAMADLVIGNLEAHVLNKPLLTPVV